MRNCLRYFTDGMLLLSMLLFLDHLVPVAKGATAVPLVDPPFSGTIFIDPDIITHADPTAFQAAVYTGQSARTMFDRRVNDWITVDAYLFDATFSDGLTAEIQVNPEFGSSGNAMIEAQTYGEAIGRIPTVLRSEMETVWIHKGVEPFGGGNNNILIHTGQADLYIADGILEETLVHEGSHTSLDATHAAAPGWLAAQGADPTFISTYARDNPTREDIAESFLSYLAIRYRSGRISQTLAETISQTIPNRIAYFDSQSFAMFPIPVDTPIAPGDANGDGIVDAGDLSALVLEIFDGDGVDPTAAVGGTFPGTIGSDANGDGAIDAGDLSCTVLIIFNGSGACSSIDTIPG